MWTTETLDRWSNTIVIVKKDGNVRGSVKFFTQNTNIESISEEETEELKKFVSLVEQMNDEE